MLTLFDQCCSTLLLSQLSRLYNYVQWFNDWQWASKFLNFSIWTIADMKLNSYNFGQLLLNFKLVTLTFLSEIIFTFTSMKEKCHILYKYEGKIPHLIQQWRLQLEHQRWIVWTLPPQKRTSPEMGGNLTIGIF